VELIWLAGRLMPDFKTIADFRKDNGAGRERGDGKPMVGLSSRGESRARPRRAGTAQRHAPRAGELAGGDQTSTSMTVFASRAAASALTFEPGMPDETNAAR
jgi:hypothetical protein